MTNEKICAHVVSKINPRDEVLDIGCGTGSLLNCLAKKLHRPVIGVDASNQGFRQARKRCRELHTCHHLELVRGKAEQLKNVIGRRKFDAITFIHSLHHMRSVRQVLRQSRQTLAPGGKLIIAEYTLKRRKRWRRCGRYSIAAIADALIKCRFTRITIEQPEKEFFFLTAARPDYGV